MMFWLGFLLGVWVQFFQWSWDSIREFCESGAHEGISGIVLPPVHEHIALTPPTWWERYQIVSYKLITRSGNEEGLKRILRSCHRVGIKVYVDLILNHMAGFDSGQGFGGTQFTKFFYPGTWEYDDFNHCGRHGDNVIRNFKDKYELQYCMLLNLADLATGKNKVRQKLTEVVRQLLDMGVDGFRLDAVKHIPVADLQAILNPVKNKGFYFQELFMGLDEPVTYDEYSVIGPMTFFAYPYKMSEALEKKDFQILKNFFEHETIDSHKAIVFVDNHDLKRLKQDQPWLLKASTLEFYYRVAHALMLLYPYGQPLVLADYKFTHPDDPPPLKSDGTIAPVGGLVQGQCRGQWQCPFFWPEWSHILDLKKKIGNTKPQWIVWQDGRLLWHWPQVGVFLGLNLNLTPWSIPLSKVHVSNLKGVMIRQEGQRVVFKTLALSSSIRIEPMQMIMIWP